MADQHSWTVPQPNNASSFGQLSQISGSDNKNQISDDKFGSQFDNGKQEQIVMAFSPQPQYYDVPLSPDRFKLHSLQYDDTSSIINGDDETMIENPDQQAFMLQCNKNINSPPPFLEYKKMQDFIKSKNSDSFKSTISSDSAQNPNIYTVTITTNSKESI
ncbi:MAG: hypothetical protein EZS28_028719 [Streblomastix strix]|uniref:Uncharacterized protein n=1 Tax=Streblomastix strix TaxID=222440 RepID=A0A5J4UZT5_9EUKA|nr:MAG: hypothetical protein EZS28_028719 [Streblomastix strix]